MTDDGERSGDEARPDDGDRVDAAASEAGSEVDAVTDIEGVDGVEGLSDLDDVGALADEEGPGEAADVGGDDLPAGDEESTPGGGPDADGGRDTDSGPGVDDGSGTGDGPGADDGSDADEGARTDDGLGGDDRSRAEDGPAAGERTRPGEDALAAGDAPGDIPPGEVDRVFGLMEEAVTNDALEGSQLDRFFRVLEGVLAGSSETNPETLAELLSLLEDALLEPDDLEDVDGLLSVLEEVVTGTTATDPEHVEAVFDVIGEGLSDPTALGPEDVERFRAGLEGALMDLAEPVGGIGRLFSVPGATGGEGVDADAGEPAPGGRPAEEATDLFRIARVAAGLTQRATGYSVESSLRTGTRLAYAAANAESPARLLTEARAITLDELQRAGIDLGDQQEGWLEAHREELVDRRPITREVLLERGERLLVQSAEIGRDDEFHPAFASILDELTGDEARILRLLATEGVQPSMDVRDRGYVPFRSRLVAANLTKLGSDAGCRHPERTPAYLQNLERLGLITFSDDPIEDLKVYQVLEAQPHIDAARDAAKRVKTVYGSVHLTDFGIDFCRTCLPVTVAFETPGTKFRREAEREKEREAERTRNPDADDE